MWQLLSLLLVSVLGFAQPGWAQENARRVAVAGGNESHNGLGLERREMPASIFRPLRVGQKVNVEERGGMSEIHLLMDGSVGAYTILELGRLHLLVEDVVGVSRRWIPVTSIRAVVWTRIPQQTPNRP